MKKKFKSSYKDLNDGSEVKTKVTARLIDLTENLGNKFIFIEVEQKEKDHTVSEEISIQQKDVKKLIKILRKFKED